MPRVAPRATTTVSRRSTAAALAARARRCESCQALRGEIAEAVERDAVELALALAAKILAGALEAQPERVDRCRAGRAAARR